MTAQWTPISGSPMRHGATALGGAALVSPDFRTMLRKPGGGSGRLRPEEGPEEGIDAFRCGGDPGERSLQAARQYGRAAANRAGDDGRSEGPGQRRAVQLLQRGQLEPAGGR